MKIKKILIIGIIFQLFGCVPITQLLFPFNPLPQPNGEYNIGSQIYTWTDSTRQEWFTKNDTTDYRKLAVQIWYPSTQKPISKPMPYIDFIDKRIPILANQLSDHLNLYLPIIHKKLRLPHYFVKHFNNMLSYAYEGLSIIENGNLPILIFSHGLGGMRTQNSVYIQQLASHGYIVVAMDHAYDANISVFSDGKIALFNSDIPEDLPKNIQNDIRSTQLKTRSEDITFIIDQLYNLNNNAHSDFYNKFALKNIGVFGHSFGGTTSIYASIMDERIKACLALDPWYEPLPKNIINNGLTIPYLHIGQEYWESKLNYKVRDEILKNTQSTNFVSTIIGSKHPDFIDFPLMVPKRIQNMLKNNENFGTMNPRYVYNILNDLQLNFFNSYVKLSSSFNHEKIANNFQVLEILKNNYPNS